MDCWWMFRNRQIEEDKPSFHLHIILLSEYVMNDIDKVTCDAITEQGC